MNTNFENVPSELRARPSWVGWKYAHTKDGKETKLPINLCTGQLASTTGPATWVAFEKAVASNSGFEGLGFVFTELDPFCGIDFDGCRDQRTGEVSEWAAELIRKLDSYTELSPSETGIKVFCKAKAPPGIRHKILVDAPAVSGKQPGIEIYDRSRYFAVTGRRDMSLPAEPMERQAQVDELIAAFFTRPAQPAADSAASSARTSVVERARKYLATLPPAISGQNGHGATFRAACILVIGFELGKPEAMELLREYNRRCKPPWTDRELEHKIDSAFEQPGERGYLRDRSDSEWAQIPIPEYKAPPLSKLEPGTAEVETQSYIEFAPAFLAVEDPPVEYLIAELLPQSILALIHGAPRTQKSWAALEFAIALATGTPAFGMERFAVPHALPVLYSSQEDAAREVRARAKAILRGRGINRFPETLAFSVHKGINLESSEWQEALLRDLAQHRFALVIFDPIRRYAMNVDKGPAEVRAVTGFLRRLTVETGAAIMPVHHDVKPGADGRDDRPRGQRASGGDWFAAAECPIALERNGTSYSLVVPEAYKLSMDPTPFTFRLETDDQRAPTTARLIGETANTEDTKILALQGKIRGYLFEHQAGASGNSITKHCRARREDVTCALEAMRESGEVDSYGGEIKGRKVTWFLVKKDE